MDQRPLYNAIPGTPHTALWYFLLIYHADRADKRQNLSEPPSLETA